jgi:hypothetical protein
MKRYYEQVYDNLKQIENNRNIENPVKQIDQDQQNILDKNNESQKLWLANYIKAIILNSVEYVKRYHTGYKTNLIAIHNLLLIQRDKFKELNK